MELEKAHIDIQEDFVDQIDHEQKILFVNRKPGLYLKEVEGKGQGVFCIDPIDAGEEIEVTPALILNEKDNASIEDTIINYYAFSTGEISSELRKQSGIRSLKKTGAVVMGIASYCNHDEQPNAKIFWQEHEGKLYYSLEALVPIPADSEICTTYGEDWFKNR